MVTVRKWRKEAVRGPGGTSWRLVAGRADARVRLNLGRICEDEAERALAGIETAEAQRTADAVVARFKDDPIGAIRHLAVDPAEREWFPAPSVDFGAMTIAEYYDAVYWPVRSDPASEIGVVEATVCNEALLWRHTGRTPTGDVKARRGILDGPIGELRMRDLADPRGQNADVLWHAWLTSQTHLSARSKALVRNAYRCLLSYARSQGHTTFKPEFHRLKGASGGLTAEKIDPLDIDEAAALLRVADPMRRAMWGIAIGQGLRPSELVRMQWRDVDWTARMLAVRGTKTEKAKATIPLTPLGHRTLRDYWVELGQPAAGLCFQYGGRGMEREPTTARPFKSYKKALASDAREAGITRRVTPYLLRHSFATIAWALDLSEDVASRIMRHTSTRMLREVYARPRPAEIAAKVAAFDVA